MLKADELHKNESYIDGVWRCARPLPHEPSGEGG